MVIFKISDKTTRKAAFISPKTAIELEIGFPGYGGSSTINRPFSTYIPRS